MFGAGEGSQICQVAEVSDAPGPGGADRIKLRHQAPCAAVGECRRRRQPLRRDYQDGACAQAPRLNLDAVPAQRQVHRKGNQGSARQGTGNVQFFSGRSRPFEVPAAAVFQDDPGLCPDPCRKVDGNLPAPAFPENDGAGQDPAPRLQLCIRNGLSQLFLGFGSLAQGSQHPPESLIGDLTPRSIPAVERCGHVMMFGKTVQERGASLGYASGIRFSHVPRVLSRPKVLSGLSFVFR